MPRLKFYILKITPQTQIRIVRGDRIYFKVPEDKLTPQGLKRKNRLIQYSKYKMALFEASRDVNFIMPKSGARIEFFIPVPRSWSGLKKKRHHLKPHESTPDLDNLIKAMKDGLMKEDKGIWNYTLTKTWINESTGHIKITVK